MNIWQNLRDRLRRWTAQGRLRNARIRRLIWGVLFFAILLVIIVEQTAPTRFNLAEGDIAPVDVVAPRQVENRIATQRKREAAAAAVTPQPKKDPTVLSQGEDFISEAFRQVSLVRAFSTQDEKTKVDALAERLKLGPSVPNEIYANLLTAPEAKLNAARQQAINLLRSALEAGLPEQNVTATKERIEQEAEPFALNIEEPWLRTFVKEMVKSRVRANEGIDEEKTAQLRQLAFQAEEPIYWQKDQTIVSKGQPVTAEQFAMLQDLGLVGGPASYRTWLGAALVSLMMVGLMALYLVRTRPDVLERDSKVLLLGLVGVLTLLLGIVMHMFADKLGPSASYLMPIAFNAMLLTILLDPRTALLQSVLISVVAAMFAQANPLNHVGVSIVGSVVGIYSVTRVDSRTDIYRAGLFVGAAGAITVFGLDVVQGAPLLDITLWKDVGLSAANGLLVAVFATGALPIFENLFGVVTPLKLLELSNPNHPLLKKLMVEAPGSYHHTILVANLCEAAAEAVGADQVLARVGAYYHDIGKIKRPAFFVENQFGGENPHDKLPPSLSAMIITSHVKEGLELAREARLPQEIIDFIPEHHGTTLVSYFYHMASKNGQSEYVLEEDFRYDGPKPRRKETAICMLADGCEASVRAMRQRGHLTHDQIEAQVKRIIDDRLKQGQLENCDLTLRELDQIARVFSKVLSGVHHARIDYPAEAGQAKQATPPAAGGAEEAPKDGDLDQQRSGTGGGDAGAGGDGAEGGQQRPGGGGEPPRA